MGLFLGGRHRLICIVLSLCKHACKEGCDVNPGIDPYFLLARSCNRWWPDFVTFTACKKSRFRLKRGKKARCVSNRCKDLFERKNILGLGALWLFFFCVLTLTSQVYWSVHFTLWYMIFTVSTLYFCLILLKKSNFETSLTQWKAKNLLQDHHREWFAGLLGK